MNSPATFWSWMHKQYWLRLCVSSFCASLLVWQLQARKVAKETPQWKIDRIFEEVFQLSLSMLIFSYVCMCGNNFEYRPFSLKVCRCRPTVSQKGPNLLRRKMVNPFACMCSHIGTNMCIHTGMQANACTHSRAHKFSQYPMHLYVLSCTIFLSQNNE